MKMSLSAPKFDHAKAYKEVLETLTLLSVYAALHRILPTITSNMIGNNGSTSVKVGRLNYKVIRVGNNYIFKYLVDGEVSSEDMFFDTLGELTLGNSL